MKRSKKLYILLGVLVVACIATFAVMHMEERKEQIKNSGETILELSGDSIQALSWEHNGETLAFHKDGAWLYDEDENFPVSEDMVNELLAQFQPLSAAFVIENVEDYGQYGLDDPVCTIHLTAEEQSYEIKLGDFSKMDSQRYVSVGDGNVYLAQHDPLDEFDAVLSDMIAHDETPAFDQVTKIQFSGAEDYTITYKENSSDTYSADDVYFAQLEGKNLPLDTSKVESYLRSITNLNPTNYVSYNVTEQELQTYGLDAPKLTITVDYTTEEDGKDTANTFALHVTPDPEVPETTEPSDEEEQNEEIKAYIRVGESQIVYEISSDKRAALTAASYNDLRHPEVLWADFSDVQQIDISLEGNSYTLTCQKDGKNRAWLYHEEEVEITDLQKALQALKADDFTSEKPIQQEEISLTVHLDNEYFPEVQIELYRYDGTRCLAMVDGISVSFVERTDVVSLIEAVHSIVLANSEQ